jgi:hypothetical protein
MTNVQQADKVKYPVDPMATPEASDFDPKGLVFGRKGSCSNIPQNLIHVKGFPGMVGRKAWRGLVSSNGMLSPDDFAIPNSNKTGETWTAGTMASTRFGQTLQTINAPSTKNKNPNS